MYGERWIIWPAPAMYGTRNCKIPYPKGEVSKQLVARTNEALTNWEMVQPYFAAVARTHFNLQSLAQDSDLEYALAYLGYQSVWFADDTGGKDYDWQAALVDISGLEEAIRRVKGRIIMSKHAQQHDAPEKEAVNDTTNPKADEFENEEWAFWQWQQMCSVPGRKKPEEVPEPDEMEF